MGIIEELASLRGAVDTLSRAVGRHGRVPEQRWGTVTATGSGETRVTFPGETGDCIVTQSTEAVWLGARVLVQVQGSDRWIVGLGGGSVPAGSSVMFSGAVVPPGWLREDGAAYSRATYWRLYAALGGNLSPFGQGNGTTTFNVPNSAGRVWLGEGIATGAPGATTHTIGQTGGEEKHALTASENGPHTHATYINTTLVNARTSGGATYNVDGSGTTATDWSGSGTPHNTLPPYITKTPIIKF